MSCRVINRFFFQYVGLLMSLLPGNSNYPVIDGADAFGSWNTVTGLLPAVHVRAFRCQPEHKPRWPMQEMFCRGAHHWRDKKAMLALKGE